MTDPETHSEAGIPVGVLTMPEMLPLVHCTPNRLASGRQDGEGRPSGGESSFRGPSRGARELLGWSSTNGSMHLGNDA